MMSVQMNLAREEPVGLKNKEVVKSLVVLMAILEVFPILGWIILTAVAIHLLLAGLFGHVVDKEMLVMEVVLGLLTVSPLPNWLLRATIRLLFRRINVTVTVVGAGLLYQGFTRLQDVTEEEEV